MKIYDCFSYFDEDFLLDLRLNILDKYVDFFVIVEGNKTWQNNDKPFNFKIENFKKFEKKIIYLKVEKYPEGDNPWIRENFQRNYISNGIEKSDKNDWIIVSDLDEIPNPKKIKYFDPKKKFAAFKQKLYYYKLNLQSKKNPDWLGSRICVKKNLKSPQWLRNLKFKKRPFWRIDKLNLNNIIDEGGWHFCNVKSPEKLLYKYKNLCETEDNFAFDQKIDDSYLNIESIKDMIIKKKDIIGRDDNFIIKKIDNHFPDYIRENINILSDWIEK